MSTKNAEVIPVRGSANGALAGRIAVITGASGSIGGAACRTLVRHGAAIAASGRNLAALERIVAEIRSEGGTRSLSRLT